jgi:hypothetical protein
MKTNLKDVAHEKFIKTARKLSGVSPVAQGSKVPPWLRRKIIAASKTSGLDFDAAYTRAGMAYKLFHKLLVQLDEIDRVALKGQHCSYRGLFDHTGITKIDGQLCYVLEPYPGGKTERDWKDFVSFAAARLSKTLDCCVYFTSTSWHYPENTYRIVFSEKEI